MKKIIFLICISGILFGNALIEILPYKTNEFSPKLGQKFKIKYKLSQDSNVTFNIFTPDNNLIRIIKKESKKGTNSVVWDGKDRDGIVVPNEAYSLKVVIKSSDKNQTLDYRLTGGEILKKLHTKVDKRGNVIFKLPKPARVLVRAGIENGPMLRVISNWEPKNRGIVKIKWNMLDKDNLIDISKLDFGVTVSAYALPERTIITTNNNSTNYYEYFTKNKFKCNLPKKYKLTKSNIAISKHFFKCRVDDKDPKIYLKFPKEFEKNREIILTNDKPLNVKVLMDKEDEERFNKSKYEVTFFIDNEFASEEELGFMPISWRFVPNGLKKGKHILTVNISSFTGQVGLSSAIFEIK